MAQLPNLYQLGVDLRQKFDEIINDSLYTDDTETGVTQKIGAFEKGDKVVNLEYKQLVDKLFHPYVPISNVKIVSTDYTKIHKVGTTFTVKDIIVSWDAGSTPVTKVDIYKDSGLLNTVNVTGSSALLRIDLNLVIDNSCRIYVTVRDAEGSYNSNTLEFKFINPFIYGFSDVSILDKDFNIEKVNITEDLTEKDNKTFSVSVDKKYPLFAYPSEYKQLSKLLDDNGINIIRSTDSKILSYNGSNYICYTADINTANNYQYTLVF